MSFLGSASSSQGTYTLERILSDITSATHLHALNQTLRGFAPKDVREPMLASLLPGNQDPLAVLHSQRNTLGILYILSARFITTTNLPPLESIEQFCRDFDPAQACWAPDRVTMLAKGLVSVAESMNSPKLPLTCLFHLVTRFPPSPSHLTSIHPLFVSACVSAGYFELALSVLKTPITEIDTTVSDLTYNDNLIYHYAGGMALAALKRWEEAEEFFEICVTSPAAVPAAIQLDAYKKLILVQLISRGTTTHVPKYTHSILTRMIKSSPYTVLVKAYPQPTSSLRPIVEKDISAFTTDNNIGLVNQAVERAPRWLIKKLTSTYLTLGLAEIGKSVGITNLEEVRGTVLSMIERDEICATISADGTVTFSDPPSQFSKAEIDRVLRNAQEQGELLLALDKAMGKSKDFISKVSKNKDEWAPQDEELFNPATGGNVWAEEGY